MYVNRADIGHNAAFRKITANATLDPAVLLNGVDTSHGPITITAPSPTIDDIALFIWDYSGTAGTNAITVVAGSTTFQISNNGGAALLVSGGGKYGILGSGSGGSANGWVQGGNAFAALGVLGTLDANGLSIITGGIQRALFDLLGNFLPPADGAGQLGTDALRWGLVRGVTLVGGDHVYLDEAGKAQWTLKEGPDAMYAFNHKTGKCHELVMREVEPPHGMVFARARHAAHIELDRWVQEHEARAQEIATDFAEAIAAAESSHEAGSHEDADYYLDHCRSWLSELQARIATIDDAIDEADGRHDTHLDIRARRVRAIEDGLRAQLAHRDRLATPAQEDH